MPLFINLSCANIILALSASTVDHSTSDVVLALRTGDYVSEHLCVLTPDLLALGGERQGGDKSDTAQNSLTVSFD